MSQNKFYGNIGIFKLYNFFLLCQIIVPCITSTSQPKVKSVYLVFLSKAEHSRLQRGPVFEGILDRVVYWIIFSSLGFYCVQACTG